MGNMSYCRFENTANDLEDCLEHIDDKLEGDEKHARRRLIQAAREIVAAADKADDEGDDS